MNISESRRSFFKQTAMLSAAGMMLPACQSNTPLSEKIELPDQLRILFQGDSITDSSRDRSSTQSNDFKGNGQWLCPDGCNKALDRSSHCGLAHL